MQSRYYNPEIGRFINADALVSTGQGVLGNNMLAYCRNNPVFRIDISGTADMDSFDPDCNPATDEKNEGAKPSGGSTLYSGPAKSRGSTSSNKTTSTKGNFRKNLMKHTGNEGKGQHAHHVFPKKFAKSFQKIGINVNDVQNGAWWEAQSHLENSYEYNQWWESFFSIEGVTAADAYAVADLLATLFGFGWSF